jgi:hypothetical protein
MNVEYKGFWWLPSNPEHRVAGLLYYAPSEEIRLELIGTFFSEDVDSAMAIVHLNDEEVIHGEAADGTYITLFDCICGLNHKGNASFTTSIYKARVIAIGILVGSLDEQRFFKASVRIPELSYWLYPSTVQAFHTEDGNGPSLYVKMERHPEEEREVAKTEVSDGFSVALCRNAYFHSGDLYFTPTFEQYTSLTIDSSTGSSLKMFYEKAVRFERFMSFATFREVGFSELALFSRDYYSPVGKKIAYKPIMVDTVFHQKPCPAKIEKHRFLFDYNQVKDKYPQVIEKWFSNDEKFGAIRAHFLDSIDFHGPFSYINFLVIIQAVEGYGRRFMKKQFAEYRRSLPADRKKQPMLELLQTVFANYSDVSVINQSTDLDAIVQTRNYHSHLLPQKSEKAVDGFELYDLTDELRRILICCILSYLGFTNNEINDLLSSTYCELFKQ